MKWLIDFAVSSVGRKQFMAVTGLGFMGFLAAHLGGNLTMYFGGDAFNSYAEHLHSLDPLLNVAEAGLLGMAAVHIGTAAWLVFGNFMARPRRYLVSRSEGGRTLSSATMPYTGILILTFVVIHLLNFTFVDHYLDISIIVSNVLQEPAYVALYMIAMVVVALHVRHGLWSAFQTVGINHPKYMPAIKAVSIVFPIVLAIGFGSLPILVMMGGIDPAITAAAP